MSFHFHLFIICCSITRNHHHPVLTNTKALYYDNDEIVFSFHYNYNNSIVKRRFKDKTFFKIFPAKL